MLKLLFLLTIFTVNPRVKIVGNRVLSHSIILNTISNCISQEDSVIALKILNLYLQRGFPFARVKIQRDRNSIVISIVEGPLAKISSIQVSPEKYRGIVSILPRVQGKIFDPRMVKTIERRVNSTKFLKFDHLSFLKTETGISLLVHVKEEKPPGMLIAALAGRPENLSGILNLKFLSFAGRPVNFDLSYSRISSLKRTMELDFTLPYIFGLGLSIYGTYRSEIEATRTSSTLGFGFTLRIAGFELNQGIQKRDTLIYAVTGAGLKTGILSLKSKIIYRTEEYRFTSHLDLNVWRLTPGVFLFSQSNSHFDVEKLGGLRYLRGYPYASIEAVEGWVAKLDLEISGPFFVFGDYGVIKGNTYRSVGLGMRFSNGEIVYGLKPGDSFADGILTIALKIGF